MEHHLQFGTSLRLLDQRLLPTGQVYVTCETAHQTADAIRDMVVRGAPAIGIAAAYGMALAALRGDDLDEAASVLVAARPTAVNLGWAVEAMRRLPREAIPDAARALHAQDVRINRALGDHGAALL